MIVTLFKGNRLFTLTLPEKVKGQYWLCDEDGNRQPRRLMGIEAENGQWVLKGSRAAAPLDKNGAPLASVVLAPQLFLEAAAENCTDRVLLFTEMPDQSRLTFAKVLVTAPEKLVIGRNAGSNLQYDSLFVSGEHARLDFDGREFSITDLGSTNGTYVNGVRVGSARLSAGDTVYIMGLKVVIGNGFFAVNNPDGLLKLYGQHLAGYTPQQPEQPQCSAAAGAELFSREPRLIDLPRAEKIRIDAPPAARTQQEMPAAFLMGPAITMALTSLCVALISVTNTRADGGSWMQAAPSLLMSASMMISAVLWPTLTRKFEKQKILADEKIRQERYLAYLDRVRDRICRMSDAQCSLLAAESPAPLQCAQTILQKSSTLWNRSSTQPDFLHLRLGSGTLPLLAEVEYEEQRFSLADDTLQGAMLALGQEPRVLQDVPVTLDLKKESVVGVYGDKTRVHTLLEALWLQLISQYGYDEVKIAVLSEHEERWSFVRFLPHCWNEEKTARYFACTEEEAKELSVQLYTLQETGTAHCVVICDSPELLRRCETVRRAVEQTGEAAQTQPGAQTAPARLSVVLGAESRSETPKESSALVEICGEKGRLYICRRAGEKPVEFVPDEVPENLLGTAAQRLANLQLDTRNAAYIMPGILTFMELYGVGKIEHFNVLTRWKENNPVISLKAPIGVDEHGEPFYLDLHEKYHGPHGLIAGMTGSGKSEFIITYILSLALNYHPDEVSFILIDYKGGGLAGAFEDEERGIHLPHLAGTITNLDGAAIQRSLISVQSELRRRQSIFNEARHKANEGTMDIYKYQQLYREGVVSEPVPHLFIISDEFAELKAQQPEFMEQLISTARIGRSLGVHLILATQKPNGVVNDQIWSNSRFRVCLKVQERADSMDMIKRPDAAAIAQTGRFYLQVGFNELFALGQSAWCGAEYIPSETAEKKPDASVQVIDRTGREVLRTAPARRQKEKHAKQVVAIVKYLSDLAAEEQVGAKPLWLPAIPAKIYQDALEEKYGVRDTGFVLAPVVGEYDDPANQKQGALTLPITAEGNVLLYGSGGAGKDEFAATLCYALLKNHTARELNLYILDFGAETLRAFEKAPQVGGAAIGIEKEKIQSLMRYLQRELARRKKLFAPYGGDHAAYCRHSGSTEPNIVVLLHNYPAFLEQYEDLADAAARLCREGTHCGIYFVMTAANGSSVRYSMAQNFGIQMTLRQNDAMEYSSIVGRTGGMVPTNCMGRGLVRRKELYEFQTALCTQEEDVPGFMRRWCEALAQNADAFAVPIPMLPERVSAASLLALPASCARVPVGFANSTAEPAYVNLTASTLFPVASDDAEALKNFVQEWLPVLENAAPVTLLDAGRKLPPESLPGCKVPQQMNEAVSALFEELVSRNNTYKDSGCKAASLQEFAEKIVLIYDMPALIKALDDEHKNALSLLLERFEANYKMHFVLANTGAQWRALTGESWYAQRMNTGSGIWLGNDAANQRVLEIHASRELYAALEPGFGWVVKRGNTELVKLASAQSEEE